MSTLTKAQMPLVVRPGPFVWLGGWISAAAAVVFYGGTILVINAIQMLSLVVRPFSLSAFRAINRFVADLWWGWCVVGAEKVFGVEPVFTGDEIPMHENAIVFANHQQMPDILVVMMLARRKDRLGDMKWFVKEPLKYVPGVGWGMQFLDCLFVKRDWLADKRKILTTFEKFLKYRIPIWLITFVEGTRITPAKQEKSQNYARRRNLPRLQHVMSPKTRGFTAAVEGLGSHIQAVYDITIGYEGGIPRIHHIVRGLVNRVHIDVRRFPVDALPNGEPELAAWLHQRFVRKDEILGQLFHSGRFPA